MRQILAISPHLVAAGIEQKVVVGLCDDSERVAEFPDLNVSFVPGLGKGQGVISTALALVTITRIIRDFQPDVIHTHLSRAGVVGRLAARICGIPVVHTFHGHVMNGYFGVFRSALIRRVECSLARLSSALIALSPNLADDLADRLDLCRGDKLMVLAPGADFQRFDERSPLPELVQRPGPGLLFVGRITPIKGLDVFLEVLAELSRRGRHLPVAIFGSGDADYVTGMKNTAARLGLADRITWFQESDNPWRHLFEKPILVLTSRSEGVPLVVLESLYNGIPVVAHALDGLRDVELCLPHRGSLVLVDAKDRMAMVQALERLLDGNVEAGFQRLELRSALKNRFGAARLANELAALYRKVAGRHGNL